MIKNFKYPNLFLLCSLAANIATVPVLAAHTHESSTLAIGNDDTEFVFAGRCPNQEPYRIFSYQMEIDGLTQSFYDYEGPAGKGTIRTSIQPRKMIIRLCHELADINGGSKFD